MSPMAIPPRPPPTSQMQTLNFWNNPGPACLGALFLGRTAADQYRCSTRFGNLQVLQAPNLHIRLSGKNVPWIQSTLACASRMPSRVFLAKPDRQLGVDTPVAYHHHHHHLTTSLHRGIDLADPIGQPSVGSTICLHARLPRRAAEQSQQPCCTRVKM